jgi:HAD superfamily hydrolase (TIGR01509 family)
MMEATCTTPRLRAVLFDVDGTLVSTKRLYLEAYRRALAAHLGHLPSAEEVVALRPHAELKFLRSVVGPEHYDACLTDFRRLYAELHATHFGGVYPGVEAMLAALRAAGLRLGIVTGKSRVSWNVMAAHVDLGPFDVTVFDEDVAEPKPAPEGLLLALSLLDLLPGEAAYVGDSLVDARAATAAGMQPLAALWPKRPEELDGFVEQARAAGARLVRTPAQVVELAV